MKRINPVSFSEKDKVTLQHIPYSKTVGWFECYDRCFLFS